MKCLVVTTVFIFFLAVTGCKSNGSGGSGRTDSTLTAGKYLFGLTVQESAMWKYKIDGKDSFFVPVNDTLRNPTGRPVYDSTRKVIVAYDTTGKAVFNYPVYITTRWVPVPARQVKETWDKKLN